MPSPHVEQDASCANSTGLTAPKGVTKTTLPVSKAVNFPPVFRCFITSSRDAPIGHLTVQVLPFGTVNPGIARTSAGIKKTGTKSLFTNWLFAMEPGVLPMDLLLSNQSPGVIMYLIYLNLPFFSIYTYIIEPWTLCSPVPPAPTQRPVRIARGRRTVFIPFSPNPNH